MPSFCVCRTLYFILCTILYYMCIGFLFNSLNFTYKNICVEHQMCLLCPVQNGFANESFIHLNNRFLFMIFGINADNNLPTHSVLRENWFTFGFLIIFVLKFYLNWISGNAYFYFKWCLNISWKIKMEIIECN